MKCYVGSIILFRRIRITFTHSFHLHHSYTIFDLLYLQECELFKLGAPTSFKYAKNGNTSQSLQKTMSYQTPPFKRNKPYIQMNIVILDRKNQRAKRSTIVSAPPHSPTVNVSPFLSDSKRHQQALNKTKHKQKNKRPGSCT